MHPMTIVSTLFPLFLTGLVNRVNFVLQLLGYYHYYMYGGDEHNTELSIGAILDIASSTAFSTGGDGPDRTSHGAREASARTETHTFRNHAPAMPCVCMCGRRNFNFLFKVFVVGCFLIG